jgi:hypothetical protein
MAGVTENYSKIEVGAVIRFLQAEGVSQSEIRRRSLSVYGQKVFSQEEMSVWFNKFNDCRTALNDDPGKHRSRPKASHTDGNCVIFKSLVKEDRRSNFVKRIAKNSCAVFNIPWTGALP